MQQAGAGETVVGRVAPCRIVKVPDFVDDRGGLASVEAGETIGFAIERVYYLYGMPPGTVRGAPAPRALEQLLLALHGEFDITVDDGRRRTRFHLDDPTRGLYIGPMIWRNLENFSPGAVGLVLASSHYDEADYYRRYDEFLRDAERLG